MSAPAGRVRADNHGGKRTVFIDGQDFIARFLQHVLPPGFKRIRHYGLLSSALKAHKLAAAREALAMPAANEQAREDAAAFPARVRTLLHLVEQRRRVLDDTSNTSSHVRGPSARFR